MTTQTHKFGDLLRNLRKRKGVQLGMMADLLDVAPSYLSDIELGRRHPFKADLIAHCGRILGLSDSDLADLFAAASLQRGAIELEVTPSRPRSLETGAALMREWPTLPDDAFREIGDIVRRYSAKKD
jgi:transcriptional regulator with XRE-family HTH domain